MAATPPPPPGAAGSPMGAPSPPAPPVTLADITAPMEAMLVPSTEVIRAAEAKLVAVLKRPSVVPPLMQVLESHPNEYIRQMAAVFLRARINSVWIRLSGEDQNKVKAFLLDRLAKEPHRLVRRSVSGVCGALTKHLLPSGQWPEFTAAMMAMADSPDAAFREVGMHLLTAMLEGLGDRIAPQISSVVELVRKGLTDTSLPVRIQTLKSLSIVVCFHAKAVVKAVRELVPVIMETLATCLTGDEHAARSTLDVVSDMAMSTHGFLSPYVQPTCSGMAQIMAREDLEPSTRDIAALVLRHLIESKPKAVAKAPGLVNQLLLTCFQVAQTYDPEEERERELMGHEQLNRLDPTPANMAGLTVDYICNFVASKHVFKPLLSLAVPALSDPNWAVRRAGLMLLSTSAEGLCMVMRDHLQTIIPLVVALANDPNPTVKEGLMIVLAQFSEHMPQSTVDFHSQILPCVFRLLDEPSDPVVEKALYVLECFGENLKAEHLTVYLKVLMERLSALIARPSLKIKEMSVSAMGTTALAAGTQFTEFFPSVAAGMLSFLSLTAPEEMMLRGRATEALSQCIIAVGMPTANDAIQSATQKVIDGLDIEDPVLDEFSYLFLGNVATVVKEGLGDLVPEILAVAGDVIVSNQGVGFGSDSDDDALGGAVAQQIDEGTEDMTPGKVVNLVLSAQAAETKAAALMCVAQVMQHCPNLSRPLVGDTLKKLQSMLNHFNREIRQNVVLAIDYCVQAQLSGEPGFNAGGVAELSPVTRYIVDTTLFHLMEAVDQDGDRETIARIVELLMHWVNGAGPTIMQTHGTRVIEAIRMLLDEKARCQKPESDDEEEPEDHDYIVIDQVGDLIGVLAAALKSSFGPIWDSLRRHVLKYSRPSRSAMDNAMAIGVYAEVGFGMGSAFAPFVPEVLPIVLSGLDHAESSVRHNSIYATGILVECSPSDMAPHVEAVLARMLPLLAPGADVPRSVVDNVAGAICRMIMRTPSAVRLPEILPAVLSVLPLQADHAEDKGVYETVMTLLVTKNEHILANLPQALAVLAAIIPDESGVDRAIAGTVAGALPRVAANLGDVFKAAAAAIPDERLKSVLHTVLGGAAPGTPTPGTPGTPGTPA